jgi:thiamine-monophosphate kinase
MASEFDIIQRYFTRPVRHSTLGVGDDAALIQPAAGHQLAISADMLVAGTHFFADTDPYRLGWKTLAVNISDMAAMGANPRWATLAIALPQPDIVWIGAFTKGFFACADAFNIDLIGGDTTRGPLTLSVQIMGEVMPDQALRRDNAEPGDDIWVSGELGTAALALNALLGKRELDASLLASCRDALELPQPRVALGLALRGIANSAIDISDGLVADLGHIMKHSGTHAEIALDKLPCNAYVSDHFREKQIQKMVLAGGDDYELCFTAPAAAASNIMEISRTLGIRLTKIGIVKPQNTGIQTVTVRDLSGNEVEWEGAGFDHFA